MEGYHPKESVAFLQLPSFFSGWHAVRRLFMHTSILAKPYIPRKPRDLWDYALFASFSPFFYSFIFHFLFNKKFPVLSSLEIPLFFLSRVAHFHRASMHHQNIGLRNMILMTGSKRVCDLWVPLNSPIGVVVYLAYL